MSDNRSDDADTETLSPLEVSPLMSEDLEDLCRLCMASERNHAPLVMVSISDKCPNSDTLVSTLLSDVLQINTHDAVSACMPQRACRECLGKLYSLAAFKEQSHCVDAKLRQIVKRKQKILEAQALYGPVFSDLDTSFTSSSAPLSFESVCDTQTSSAFPPAQEEEEKSCRNVQEVDGQWDDSATEDSETNCNKTGIFNIPDTGQKCIASCSETSSAANFSMAISPVSENNVDSVKDVPKPIYFIEGSIVTALDIPSVDNEIQAAVDDDTSCPDIIGEIIVPDSRAAGDVLTVDFVPDSSDVYEALLPEVTTNTRDIVSAEGTKKSSSSRLPVPEVFAIVGQQAEKQLGFRCPLCKKVFQSRIQFRKHAALHVKAIGGVCKHCDKWFPTSNALCRHERIHSGEKPFVCILCDRAFSQREILQRHILTHTDTKPFQCQYCDKSYAQKSGLDGHVKNHHKPTLEISQYPCILCNKAFCHPSGLSRHMLTHSGKQYVCKSCNRNFSDSSALRRHTKNKHGSSP